MRPADSLGRTDQTSFWIHKTKNLDVFLSHLSSPKYTTVGFVLSLPTHQLLLHLWAVTAMMLSAQPCKTIYYHLIAGSGFTPTGRREEREPR